MFITVYVYILQKICINMHYFTICKVHIILYVFKSHSGVLNIKCTLVIMKKMNSTQKVNVSSNE